MDVGKLHQILAKTTMQFRKGEALEGTPQLVEAIKAGAEELPGGVAEFYAMPPVPNEASKDVELVDVEFICVGVNRVEAEKQRADLVEILSEYPRLKDGPSYIEVGAQIGDQGAAFNLFALGKVLGLWNVITPAFFGFTGEEAREMAGSGFVMITGYTPTPETDDA